MQSNMETHREMAAPDKSESSGVVLGRERNLLAGLPALHSGGTVPKDGAYQLQAGEKVVAAPNIDALNAAAPKPTQESAPQPDQSSLPDADTDKLADGESVNLRKAYSRIQENLAKLFQENGIRQSFNVPYIDGQSQDEHLNTVSQAAQSAGGFTNNMILTFHTAQGKGWGSAHGSTIGFPADKLVTAVVPAKSEHAKAVIDASRAFISDAARLLGKDAPEILQARSILALISKSNAQGVSLIHMAAAFINLPAPIIKTIARKHSDTHPDGMSPQLRAPRES